MDKDIMVGIAELLKYQNIETVYDQRTSNAIYKLVEQDITGNVFFNMLPAAVPHPSTKVEFSAIEPMLLAACGSDSKSPSYQIPERAFKVGSYGGVATNEFDAWNEDRMISYWEMRNSTGQLQTMLSTNIAIDITGVATELVTRGRVLKAQMVRDALRGTMIFPVKQADGTKVDVDIATGVATIDHSAATGDNAPWSAAASTDIPAQVDEVLDATDDGVDTMLMTNKTANIMFKNLSVLEELCCETREQALRLSVQGALPLFRGLKIQVIGRKENKYNAADGTGLVFIEDTEVFFYNSDRLFAHKAMPNPTTGVGESGAEPAMKFGGVFSTKKQDDPNGIKFSLHDRFAIFVENPNGAIHMIVE